MRFDLKILGMSVAVAMTLAGCSDDPVTGGAGGDGTTTLSEEWYAGGKLGTVFNSTSSAYEQSTPVVDKDPTMYASFMRGETFLKTFSFRAPTPAPSVRASGRFTSATAVLPATPVTDMASA